jgi:hypothetical protein
MSRFASVNAALSIMDGLVRPNRFYVAMNLAGVQEYTAYVEAVDFPAMALGTADFQNNSQPILKIPYGKLPAQTCNITFRVDQDGKLIKSLYDYIEKVISTSTGEYFVAYPEDVWGALGIYALNINDKQIYKLELNRVLVTNIDTAQYSFDDRDSYLKQTVTFSYQEAVFKLGD